MKIIFGSTSFDFERHAKETMAAIQAKERKDGTMEPLGIAAHFARHPHICDDCGGTYWDRDRWGGNHIGCKGFRKGAGFIA